MSVAAKASIKEYEALAATPVQRVSSGEETALTSLWSDDEMCTVVFARSFGCPFCQEMARQLSRDYLSSLKEQDCKLFLVSIGTTDTGKKFAAKTNFPEDLLFADPENAAYDALNLRKGFLVTYISPMTPIAIATRALRSGLKDLGDVLQDWTPYQPPKGLEQASIQGGTFVFQGKECVWSHYDPATAAHANFDDVLEQVRRASVRA